MNRLTQHILTASLAVFLLASGLVAPAMSLSMDGISTSANFAYATEHDVERYQFLAPIGGLGDSTADGGRDIDVSSKDSLPNFAKSLITLTIGFAIMAAIVLLVIAGFRYMTTVKDGAKSDAKKSIGRAIGGLVLALAAVVILQTINPQLIELQGIEHVTVEGEDITDPNLTKKGWCNSISATSDTRCFDTFEECAAVDTTNLSYCYYYADSGQYQDQLGDPGQYCAEIDGIDVFGGDAYYCSDSKQACEKVEEESKNSSGSRKPDVQQDCKFIYEASVKLVNTNTGEEVTLTGFGAGKENAVNNCIAQKNNGLNSEYVETCFEGGFFAVNQSQCELAVEGQDCEVVNEEPEPVADLAKDWLGVEWCAKDDPENCKQTGKLACESSAGAGNCFRSPTSMAKKDNSNYQTSCENCVFLNEDNYKVRSSGICTPLGDGDQFCRIKEGLDSKLTNLNGSLSEDFPYVITEAFPPTVKHSSNCHYNGSCVDLALRRSEAEQADGRSKYRNSDEATQEHADKIIEFIEKAEALGLSVTYEVGTYKLRDGLWQLFYRNDKGSIADRLKTVGEDDENENGNLEPSEYGVLPHFSVYQSNGDR